MYVEIFVDLRSTSDLLFRGTCIASTCIASLFAVPERAEQRCAMFEEQDEHLEATLADLIVALTEEADRLIQNRRQAHNFVAYVSTEYFESFGAHFSDVALRKQYILSSGCFASGNACVPASGSAGISMRAQEKSREV